MYGMARNMIYNTEFYSHIERSRPDSKPFRGAL